MFVRTKQNKNQWEKCLTIKDLIFNLNQENISQSKNKILDIFDYKYPITFNIILSQLIYILFDVKVNDFDIELYINLIKEIEAIEESNNIKSKILDKFVKTNTKEACYLLAKLIEYSLIDLKSIQDNLNFPYFVHYLPEKRIEMLKKYGFFNSFQSGTNNYEELSRNNFEVHKQLIEEGVNPNEIAKIIRNDEIEKLQEISSQTNFDFNQTIEPSLYERCSFINQKDVTLIEYAAFFGSVKCFKYLLMNGANVNDTAKYSIAGGNEEIIHLCEQNHSTFEGVYETAIQFHKNDIFKYVYENKLEEINNLEEIEKKCITYYNFEIFLYLQKEGMKITDAIINEAARIGNLYLVEYFLENRQIPKDIIISPSLSKNIELVDFIIKQDGIDINIKDIFFIIYEIYFNCLIFRKIIWKLFGLFFTQPMIVSKYGYVDIVKLLLEKEGIDINAKNIFVFDLIFIELIFYFFLMFGNY